MVFKPNSSHPRTILISEESCTNNISSKWDTITAQLSKGKIIGFWITWLRNILLIQAAWEVKSIIPLYDKRIKIKLADSSSKRQLERLAQQTNQIREAFRWTRCRISTQTRHKIANTHRYLRLIKPKIWQVNWTKTASSNTNKCKIPTRVKMDCLFRQDLIEMVLSSSRQNNRRTAETI